MQLQDLFFARTIVRYPRGLSPALVDLGVVRLPDDNGSGLNLHLLGQPYFLEAYATQESRDLRLGAVNRYIEFVAADLSECDVEDGYYDERHLAVGPAWGAEGFDFVAAKVITPRLEALCENIFGGCNGFDQIIIDRVTYQVDLSSSGDVRVVAAPLYGSFVEDDVITETMRYLSKAFESELRPRHPLFDRSRA